MDKQTLSHYGWIIIMVLILAVMLAFATPFGKYIGRGISNLAMSMVAANDNAVDKNNIEQMGNEWDEYLNVGNQGGAVITYAETFADNSWTAIAHACQNNEVPATWNVGDTKPMTINGKEIQVMIIGKNHDTYADGSGIAPLTFQTGIVGEYVMNSIETSAGGWTGSDLRAYLNGEIFDTMEMKNDVKAVVKTTNIGYVDSGNVPATEVVTHNDKLFLLSKVEVGGTDKESVLNLEGAQYAYYASANSTLGNYDGAEYNGGWLRSPNLGHNNFLIVYLNAFNSLKIDYPFGISFGFCF